MDDDLQQTEALDKVQTEALDKVMRYVRKKVLIVLRHLPRIEEAEVTQEIFSEWLKERHGDVVGILPHLGDKSSEEMRQLDRAIWRGTDHVRRNEVRRCVPLDDFGYYEDPTLSLDMEQAILRLPEEQRELILLRRKGLTFDEIAEEMLIATANVWRIWISARKSLMKILSAYDNEGGGECPVIDKPR